MRQFVTEAIILSRIEFGEADRIITLLTPDHGKLRLIAKGVRRVKSKLAGGIELFSISDITYVQGRGEIGTLISTRLVKHYGQIATDIDRTMLGYDLIKQLNKATEDHPGPEYFELLRDVFEALDNKDMPLLLIRFWFSAQLLRLGGHTPNLDIDSHGNKLDAQKAYSFDFERTCFVESDQGHYVADGIKFLRLGFGTHGVKVLAQVSIGAELIEAVGPLVEQLFRIHNR